MYAKEFAPLLANRLQSTTKLPQLRLQVNEAARLARRHPAHVFFKAFDTDSLSFIQREVSDGGLVEVRRHNQSLLGWGFLDNVHRRVSMVDFSPKIVSSLPLMNEEYFMTLIRASGERRRCVLQGAHTSAYRLFHGHADGIPSLYVDVFTRSFARVIATSAGAERVVPAVSEFLRQRGCEEVLLATPLLGRNECVTFVSPTMELPPRYTEQGICFPWPSSPDLKGDTITSRFLIQPAFRRTRQLLRELCEGKRVVCLNDRGAGSSMNAVLTAKHVVIHDEEKACADWVRQTLTCAHGAEVFRQCEVATSPLHELTMTNPLDVVVMESHPEHLSTSDQWATTLERLAPQMAEGGIVVVMQEGAPLGIPEMMDATLPAAAGEEQVEDVVQRVFRARGLEPRCVRRFGPSCDFPRAPCDSTNDCFSLVFVLTSAV